MSLLDELHDEQGAPTVEDVLLLEAMTGRLRLAFLRVVRAENAEAYELREALHDARACDPNTCYLCAQARAAKATP